MRVRKLSHYTLISTPALLRLCLDALLNTQFALLSTVFLRIKKIVRACKGLLSMGLVSKSIQKLRKSQICYFSAQVCLGVITKNVKTQSEKTLHCMATRQQEEKSPVLLISCQSALFLKTSFGKEMFT